MGHVVVSVVLVPILGPHRQKAEVSDEDMNNILATSRRSITSGGQLRVSSEEKHQQTTKLKKLRHLGRHK